MNQTFARTVGSAWWIGLAGVGGCMFGPYDGQIVSTSTTSVYPWGVYPGAATSVTFEAKSTATNAFQTVTSTTTTSSTYSAFGVSWNYWQTPGVAVPSWGWRSGVTGKRAEVRTRSGTSLLYSYPASGLSCVLDRNVPGADATTAAEACKADTSPSAFLFTSDYRGMPAFTPQSPVDFPQELEHDRVEDIQGAASTSSNWYFTHNDPPELVRIPMTSSLATHGTWDAASVTGMPASLAALGYDHFGDPDEHNGFIYVPVEQGPVGAIAQFDTNLNFIGSANLYDTTKAPWVAIDPTTGLLYTSGACDVSEVDVYTMSFTGAALTGLSLVDHRTLWDQGSVPLSLQRVQGGAFSDHGNLYLVSDADYPDDECGTPGNGVSGVYGFEAGSMRKELYFYVPYNPDDYDEELEGIDIRDVTGLGAPGISGQLHVVMLDNDEHWYGQDDDLYFKHYLAAAGELGFL